MASDQLSSGRDRAALLLAALAAVAAAGATQFAWLTRPDGSLGLTVVPYYLCAAAAALAAIAVLVDWRGHIGRAQGLLFGATLLIGLAILSVALSSSRLGARLDPGAAGLQLGLAAAVASAAATFIRPVPPLLRYVVRRIALAVPVLLGVTILTFAISWTANEGHLERAYLTEKMTLDQREQIIEKYGFRDPWYVQYFRYLERLSQGDLGLSRVETDRPIMAVLSEFFPATLELTLAAMTVAVIVGIALGTITAVRKDSPVDHTTRFLALAGVSVPIFWLGLILKFALATDFPQTLFGGGDRLVRAFFLAIVFAIPVGLGLTVADALRPRAAGRRSMLIGLAIRGAVLVGLIGLGFLLAAIGFPLLAPTPLLAGLAALAVLGAVAVGLHARAPALAVLAASAAGFALVVSLLFAVGLAFVGWLALAVGAVAYPAAVALRLRGRRTLSTGGWYNAAFALGLLVLLGVSVRLLGGIGFVVAAAVALLWFVGVAVTARRRRIPGLHGVLGLAIGAAAVAGILYGATDGAPTLINDLFLVIPELPVGSRFDNALVAQEGAHPSLTEGPTRMLLVDTALARDWIAFQDVVRHLILPGITLGYASLAVIARMMRASMLEVLTLDFVRTARAKGLSEGEVVRLHARRNALIPIATVVGLTFGGLLSGAVLTETIFQWPGLGRWSTRAIGAADTNSIMAFTLFVTVIYLVANFLVDLAYSLIDPRVRLG